MLSQRLLAKTGGSSAPYPWFEIAVKIFMTSFVPQLSAEKPRTLLESHPKMRFVSNVFRPLAIWATAACLVVTISSFAGFLMEVYFTTRLERMYGQGEQRAFVWFCLLPFLIVCLALFVDTIISILYDALDHPPLARSTSLILTSPNVRRLYKNVSGESIYALFLWCYLGLLKCMGPHLIVRPTTPNYQVNKENTGVKKEETCVEKETAHVRTWLANSRQEISDEIRYMETCWVMCIIINVTVYVLSCFHQFTHQSTKLLCVAIPVLVLTFVVKPLVFQGSWQPSFATLVNVLAVTSTTCFIIYTDWPVVPKIVYLICVFLYFAVQSTDWPVVPKRVYLMCVFLYSAVQSMVGKQEETEEATPPQTPPAQQAPSSPQAPPEGLCWAVDIVMFLMWTANPIRSGILQMEQDHNHDIHGFLNGLMKCYLRTVLYFAAIMFVIDIDVRCFTRRSSVLCDIRTVAYWKQLHDRLDQETIPAGLIWYAYRGFTAEPMHLPAEREVAPMMEEGRLLPCQMCIGAIVLIALIGLFGWLTVYLPWHHRATLWNLFGEWSLLLMVGAVLVLLLLIAIFLLLLDVLCSKIWWTHVCCETWKTSLKNWHRTLGDVQLGSAKQDEQKQKQIGTEMFRRFRSIGFAAIWWWGACWLLRPSVYVPSDNRPAVYLILGALLSHLVWRCTRVITRAGWPFYIVISSFFVLALVFQSGTWTETIGGPFADKPIMKVNISSLPLLQREQQETRGTRLPYGACMRSWGSPSAPLSIIDLAELSWIAYAGDENVTRFLNESFSTRCNVEWKNHYTRLPRAIHVHFPPKDGGSGGTHVFAIKGTSTPTDVYADASLFATVQTLQWLNHILPTLTIVPLRVTQDILNIMNKLTISKHESASLLGPLQQKISKVIQHGAQHVVITGHSLGGGLAQVLASRLEVPAVVFSAPGIIYSAARLNVSLETAERDIVVIMPDGDVVPRVDLQAGQVQHIACRSLDGQSGSPASCHSLQRTTCELWRVCGDIAGRDFGDTCSQFVRKSAEGGQYFQPPDDPWRSPDGSILS